MGQSTYLIAWNGAFQDLRTYKIERIEAIDLLAEAYTIPSNFDPYATLEHAWGIWFNPGNPVRIRLLFSARVAERVKETRWHRTQEIETLPDGTLIWTASVDEPIEMTPLDPRMGSGSRSARTG